VCAYFEGNMLDSTVPYVYSDVELAVERYHKKVKNKFKNASTWGDYDDAVVYSLLTGVQVVTVMNSKDGFRVIHDSRKVLERVARMPTRKKLETPKWRNGEVSYLYYHLAGEATVVPEGRNTANHYGALIPVRENTLREGWIFEGAYNEPKAMGGHRKKSGNEDKMKEEEKGSEEEDMKKQSDERKEEVKEEEKRGEEEDIKKNSLNREEKGTQEKTQKRKEEVKEKTAAKKRKERLNMCPKREKW
jgi:hypothetical protein